MNFQGFRVDEEMGKVFEDALSHGWEFTKFRNQHFYFRHPETNQTVVAAAGFGDRRSARNTASNFKRLGPPREVEIKEKPVPQMLVKAKPVEQVVEPPPAKKAESPAPIQLTPVSASAHLPSINEIDTYILDMGDVDRRIHLGIAMLVVGLSPNEIAMRLDRSGSWVYYLRKKVLEPAYQARFYTEEDVLGISMSTAKFSDGAKRFANRFAELYPNMLPSIPQVRSAEDSKLIEQRPQIPAEVKETPMQFLKRTKAAYEAAVFDLLSAIDAVKKEGTEIIIERDNFNLKLKTRVIREEEL